MNKILRLLVPVFVLALCFKVDAQVLGDLGDVQNDEREFYTMTKQMGQFINRFNYEEDQYGKRLYSTDKDFRNTEKRRAILPLLFDLENPRTSGNLRNFFVDDLINNNQYMEFLGGDWFSEISAKFKWKGKEVDVCLIMTLEKDGLGSKWIISNVFFSEFQKHFPQGEIAEREKHFLHPMSHELDFMNIYKIFNDPQVIEYYASTNYQPDYLTLFFYEIKQGNLKFDHIESVKFHVFQIKNWYFEVSWFNRSGYNSGWLISNLVYLKDEEKEALLKIYQPKK